MIEGTDVLTTALDRARGAIEAMPVSAGVLDSGGTALLLSVKALLVAAAAGAIVLALRWVRNDYRHGRTLFAFVLSAVRVSTVALAIASLNNAVLLRSLG